MIIDFNWPISQGWECPKCGNVYSPTTVMCYSCSHQQYAPPPIPQKKTNDQLIQEMQELLEQIKSNKPQKSINCERDKDCTIKVITSDTVTSNGSAEITIDLNNLTFNEGDHK